MVPFSVIWGPLITPNHPISTFCITFRIFVVGGVTDRKFDGRLIVASASPRGINHP